MWLLFLTLHLIGLVGYNLLFRKSLVNNMDGWTLATVMQIGIAIPLVFAIFIVHPSASLYNLQSILLISFITILILATHLTIINALKYSEAGVFSILLNLRIIFTTILGIFFLGEQIVPLQIAGGLLILMAVVAVKQKGNKNLTLRGIQWGVAAALVISFLNLFEKQAINEIGFFGYIIPASIACAVIMWAILLAQGKKIELSFLKKTGVLKLIGFRMASVYGFTLALSTGGLLSVSTYISSLSVILIVILAAILLGERDYIKQKLIAVGLAVCGLTVILISNL